MGEENITHKEGNKSLVKITWMIEDKNIKTVIITTFDMFKKVKKKLQHVNWKQGLHKKIQDEHLEKTNLMF